MKCVINVTELVVSIFRNCYLGKQKYWLVLLILILTNSTNSDYILIFSANCNFSALYELFYCTCHTKTD